MLILNAGCGGSRPGSPFINLDCLRTQLAIGTNERFNLDQEDNYVESDITRPLPFPDNHFDGVMAVHVVEHLTCHQSAGFLSECRRILKPGGLLLVSVPDAEYFLSVYGEDTKAKAVELFGEPIHDEGHEKFFSYALWRHDHVQILTQQSLLCIFLRAGFGDGYEVPQFPSETYSHMLPHLTRRKFSIEMYGVK